MLWWESIDSGETLPEAAIPEKDVPTGRFLPGNNGGKGRPKGSRNKFVEALPELQSEHFNATYKNSQDKRGLLYSLELTQ